ncbi:RsmB/NOP family class I SAM-dependent RNA methyltransferase [Roseococcus sp. SDR]|uniref:RsmB/NOP family class I SAM-dependent RNA methyltransferase n=1 Tax=Roseococcus sp. SDR TaxID=2835532 RepID=UPI001BCB374D|nr:RsmB/NOP family class I SAM-dependent RNA methyltransferase [Roseococcus sp. SDR]MBS7790921.1 RsmB/NOP family class I SAM-dependent RNA methyltransferase [Roseococcus sp. SDR]MBV1846235.1 RsmB/NOP family class I SAM-dependent RNA methyltransferase [Roseococcus sp. SDR]
MTPEGRLSAAIDLLYAVLDQPRRPADAISADFFRARRYIGGGDRRAVSDLAWGVLRQRLRLEWWIGQTGARLTPRLLVLAFLLLAEKRKPNEAARLFDGGRYSAGPLDAGEMGVAEQLVGKPLMGKEMPDGPRLNLPDWALPGLATRFGATLETEARAMEATAPLDLRVNLLKTTREAAQAALRAEGLISETTPHSPWGLRLPHRTPITGSAAYKAGLIEVQDEGSQLIAALVAARPGMRVVDYCAGAAGKTLAMAATMANQGRVTACDVSAPRLEGAAKRLRRAGVHNAETHLLEAGDRWVKRRAGTFDRVLVDAPCTGTGTWRRNPDARSRTGAEDLAELLAKQDEILATSAHLVRPGGRLVFATCSLLPEEDEVQVEAFLARNPAFRPVPLATAWVEAGLPDAPPVEGQHMLLSPAAHGTDGFFCAVLEKAA